MRSSQLRVFKYKYIYQDIGRPSGKWKSNMVQFNSIKSGLNFRTWNLWIHKLKFNNWILDMIHMDMKVINFEIERLLIQNSQSIAGSYWSSKNQTERKKNRENYSTTVILRRIKYRGHLENPAWRTSEAPTIRLGCKFQPLVGGSYM